MPLADRGRVAHQVDWAWLALSLLLLALVGWTLADYPQFTDVGEDLLGGVELEYRLAGDQGRSGDFSQLLARHATTGGVLRLGSGDYLRWYFDGPFPSGYLAVQARGRSQALVVGDKPWKDGRIALVGINAAGKRLYGTGTRVCGLSGTHPWTSCDTQLRIAADATRALLVLAHHGTQGWFEVTEPQVYQAAPRDELIWVQWGVVLLWLLLTLVAARRMLRRRLGVVMLLIGAVVLVNAVIPIEQLHLLLKDLRSGMFHAAEEIKFPKSQNTEAQAVPPSALAERQTPPVSDRDLDAWLQINDIQKGGHFLAFALLGALAAFHWLSWRGQALLELAHRVLLSGGWLIWFAAATEVTQMVTLTRNGNLADFLLDLSGAATGILLVLIGFGGIRLMARLVRIRP